MKLLMVIAFSFFTLTAFAKPLPTVDYVDVPRYTGKWYAISSLPQFFTRNCKAQTAEYEVINPQTISVLNTCLKEKGQETIKGQAVVSNASTNAELIVTFDSFFTRLFRVKGDYNIIKLDKDYQYVMVGSSNRKSLWIMSRQPNMPEAVYRDYVEYAKTLNFPVDHLEISQF